jgi:transposase
VVRVESLRDLIEVYDREVAMLERKIHQLLRDDRGYQTIQTLNGVGRTIAAIFVAEIGDVTRFRSAEALCSWAGLAPRHRESDTKVVRGSITKMAPGSCAGPRSKASPATTAAPGSSRTSIASPNGAARTRPASP